MRRHRQREIREDDFSLTSQDACAPSQASGVKNTVSTVFSRLPPMPLVRAAREEKARKGFSDAITGAWARGTGTGVKNLVSTRFFTLHIRFLFHDSVCLLSLGDPRNHQGRISPTQKPDPPGSNREDPPGTHLPGTKKRRDTSHMASVQIEPV